MYLPHNNSSAIDTLAQREVGDKIEEKKLNEKILMWSKS